MLQPSFCRDDHWSSADYTYTPATAEIDGRAMRVPTISTIINQMKGHVTKQIGFSLWHTRFHDHIIRNEKEYKYIWEYINNNPARWEKDCYFV